MVGGVGCVEYWSSCPTAYPLTYVYVANALGAVRSTVLSCDRGKVDARLKQVGVVVYAKRVQRL